jgi:hypothetical protein
MTFTSGSRSARLPRISRARAVCSGGTKYGCAPFVFCAASSSIFGRSAAITSGAACSAFTAM